MSLLHQKGKRWKEWSGVNKAYIILAHKNELQVKRLVDRLKDGNSLFFLHVDLHSSFELFEQIFAPVPEVVLVKRVNTPWAEFGLVRATLNALEKIRSSGKIFERIILLSGQDYPIKTNGEIDEFFRSSPYCVFIEYYPLPNYSKWATDGGQFRIDKYFFGLAFPERIAAKAANLLGRLVPLFRRSVPEGMQPHAGSQWWVIDTYTMNYLLHFIRYNPEYLSYHRNTFAADEVFFQMILLSGTDGHLQKSISNDNLRLMRWQSSSIAHPEQLGAADLPQIKNSPALFARKFDERTDTEILDLIDLSLDLK